MKLYHDETKNGGKIKVPTNDLKNENKKKENTTLLEEAW
jgi:hypothetical protein